MKPNDPAGLRTAADALLRRLADRGVDYLFANGGTDFAPLAEALAKAAAERSPAPRPVITPHENLGVAMAHGYTMVSGRPQAMMVHVGVGSAKRLSAVKWGVASRIVWAWVLTIPASAAIAGVAYLLVLGVEKLLGYA